MTTENDTNKASQNPEARLSPNDPWIIYLRQLLDYDVLHIRQKILAISEKYYFTDQYNNPRFFVVRPPRLMANMILRIILSAVRIAILIWVVSYFLQTQEVLTSVLVLIVTNFVLGVTAVLISPYRDIGVYTDDTESWRILTITQDNKFGFHRRYTLHDCFGQQVAKFRRSTLWAMIRVVWFIETPDGKPIMCVREDSLVRAVLRRYLGPLYGILRTNFNFEFPTGGIFGKYDRKLTFTDQYMLDLQGDPERLVDRRVTLAMSILLDTGESR